MRIAAFFSVLSGLLLTAGFPKFDWYFFSWVALIPLLIALWDKTTRQAVLLGFICGLTHYLTALYWIRHVIYYYGGIPLPLALAILLLLCCYLALYPTAFALAAHRLESHPKLWVFGLPAIWVTLEWVRAHLLTGFPWANFGYTQTAFRQLVQVADITGVYGVSWLLVLVNTSLASFFGRYRLKLPPAVALGCVALTVGYGHFRLQTVEELQQRVTPWTVAVVQGNIDQAQKWDPLYQQETLGRYRRLSLQAAKHDPRPDLIVWPETAAPFFYGLDTDLTFQLTEIIAEIGVPVLFGSPSARRIEGKTRLLNSAYVVDADGRLLGDYAKQHLVPFGEYVPYQRILFFVHKLVEAAGNFAAGDDPSPITINGRKVAVLICYEAIFPGLTRLAIEHGATSIVNITNDAWFGTTSAPYQHQQMAGWRALEFRAPLIRAANTGISTIFDATGKSLGTIPLNQEGYLTATIQPLAVKTFYTVWGDLFAWACVVVAIGILAGLEWPQHCKKRTVHHSRSTD